MFASLSAFLTEASFAAFAALALAGAIASFLYLPVVGRPVAAVLLAVASALFAYDLGYAARGRLDDSGAIAAQLAEERRQSAAAQKIAEDASARQRQANERTAQINERIADYERHLPTVSSAPADPSTTSPPTPPSCAAVDRAVCGCLLTDADVRGLRNVGGTGKAASARAAGAVRPARSSP